MAAQEIEQIYIENGIIYMFEISTTFPMMLTVVIDQEFISYCWLYYRF